MVGIMGCGGPGTEYLLCNGSGTPVLCPVVPGAVC